MQSEDTTQTNQPVEPEADGYYGEDEIVVDEIDLSFLDDDDDDLAAEPQTR